MNAPLPVDALVIGAGPVGLYQVFQLGLQELACTVIDVLPQPGGQCAALYPHKPIYDIPALPVCSGAELVERLLRQIEPLRPDFRLADEATELAPLPDGRWRLRSAGGGDWAARIVVIAAGVGAFVPRRLKVAGHDALLGQGLSYHEPTAAELAGPDPLWICGADDRALGWARRAVDAGVAVRLLHRREVFEAEPEALDWLAEARATGRVELVLGLPETLQADAQGRLAALELLAPDGSSQRHALRRLHVSLGLSPRLGALAQWPLALERKLVRVDPATMASSQPGVYAVGDICHYPGKLKLIASGFHEATLAAHAAARWLRPDAPHPLEYTTSSARLQRLLGVARSP